MDTHKLEVGDKITALNNGEAYAIREISRVTDKIAFAKVRRKDNTYYELKFPREVRNNGFIFHEKGQKGWSAAGYYRLASEIDLRQIKERNIRLKISRIDWSQVGIEKIEQILGLLA